MNLLFNEMRAHQTHTKNKKRENSNSNIPHGTLNKVNISHLKKNQDLNYYQPQNNRESNQYRNRRINNTPAWKNKNEGELK